MNDLNNGISQKSNSIEAHNCSNSDKTLDEIDIIDYYGLAGHIPMQIL
jgi:hypothetical protein